MRRPDIIIVNKKETRWPGRETTYFDNEQYSDNLQLLLEMKFLKMISLGDKRMIIRK